MRVSYNNINRGFVTDYEENDDDEASKHSIHVLVRVHIYIYIGVYVYIKYIESATSGGAKKTGDRDAYIL